MKVLIIKCPKMQMARPPNPKIAIANEVQNTKIGCESLTYVIIAENVNIMLRMSHAS